MDTTDLRAAVLVLQNDIEELAESNKITEEEATGIVLAAELVAQLADALATEAEEIEHAAD